MLRICLLYVYMYVSCSLILFLYRETHGETYSVIYHPDSDQSEILCDSVFLFERKQKTIYCYNFNVIQFAHRIKSKFLFLYHDSFYCIVDSVSNVSKATREINKPKKNSNAKIDCSQFYEI